MEYQKIIILWHNTSKEPSKFRTKSWLETNDESGRTSNTNVQIKFKTTMLKSSLCDDSDAYTLGKGTILVNNTAAADNYTNNTIKKVKRKNCVPFTHCKVKQTM